MLSDVPNLAYALGYTNASWTLKCDLVAEYVCRLINRMDAGGYQQCVPRGPDPSLPTEPFIDFDSGYVLRSIDKMPRQGLTPPWRLHQNYARDLVLMRYRAVDDEAMDFARSRHGRRGRARAAPWSSRRTGQRLSQAAQERLRVDRAAAVVAAGRRPHLEMQMAGARVAGGADTADRLDRRPRPRPCERRRPPADACRRCPVSLPLPSMTT